MGLLARLRSLFGLRPRSSAPPPSRPIDFAHVLDLLRRANGAAEAWAVGLRDGDIEVGTLGAGDDRRYRGAALVQLASADGRTHIAPDGTEGGTFVAVGDFPYGAGVLLRGAAAGAPEETVDDLRRFVGGMSLAEREVLEAPAQLVPRQLALALSGAGAQTLEAVARAGADLAEQLSQRGAAIVLTLNSGDAEVIAISSAADPRLAGLVLQSAAPAARAIEQGLPIVTHAGEDVFGPGSPQRRRQERGGAAYPLVDGRATVGALVLVGRPLASDTPGGSLERIGRLVAELGPRLAAARAVHDAEQRAIRDPLTGLCNRREFERALQQYGGPGGSPAVATLIYVDLDHFKRLNDTLGHAAGDAALKHVAQLLDAAVRDGDMVARIGGEEFAVWLPHTPLDEGLEVAERIRESVSGSTWQWRSSPYILTTSCGVAACPDPIGEVANLPAAADAALYRAKQAGRNRVEKAEARH